jgi:hypothetical protein
VTGSQPAQLERLPIGTLVRMLTAVRTDAVALADGPHIAGRRRSGVSPLPRPPVRSGARLRRDAARVVRELARLEHQDDR